ncbi:MAG: DUF4249 domain-containing protein [Bacteroidales bacterium]|nr:DUF4249 domain-containing protein [Bacteroidales bacterium]
MKFLPILIFSILVLYSCRELVQDEFPYFSPVPTINSILIADSTLKVHVSLAGKIDTNQLVFIDNAEVLLYVNEQFKDTLTYFDKGIYYSSTLVEPLKTYYCEVNIPGYQKVSCSDYLPKPAIISEIVHINQAGKDEEGFTYPAIKFTFNNNPSENLYFEVAIKLIRNRYEKLVELQTITDPVILNEGLPIAVFSNELISGESYSITINYTTGSASSQGTNLYPLILEFRSVSHDYYQYVKQLYLYEKGRYPDNLASSLTAFPLYSNIHGGYGIFAGYSSIQSDTIYPY